MTVLRWVRRAWDAYRQWQYWKATLAVTASLLSAVTAVLGAWGVSGWMEERAGCPECLTADNVWHDPSDWTAQVPTGLLAFLAIIILFALVLIVMERWPMRRPDTRFDGGRDPRRLFTESDMKWVVKATGGRCEQRVLFGLLRCPRQGEQKDHWYPWARGGATSRRNLVFLCARHNNRKSDHVPTVWQRRRLLRARAAYWPDGPEWAAGLLLDGLEDTAPMPDRPPIQRRESPKTDEEREPDEPDEDPSTEEPADDDGDYWAD